MLNSNIFAHLREKCGVIGVWSESNRAPFLARRGQAALQHRGQESAGISILAEKGNIITHSGMGLIPTVITDDILKKLGESKLAIGHNRYSTSGESTAINAQPIYRKNGDFQLSIAHNGNIPDLSNVCEKYGKEETGTTDTNILADILIEERSRFVTWEETFTALLPEFKGAYSLTVLTDGGVLYGIRDPYGVRPLSLGKLPDGWIIASESVAMDSTNANYVRDIVPGEIIRISQDGMLNSFFFGEAKRKQFCIFEHIYFARPDSFLNGMRTRAGREKSGELLGKRIKKKYIQADLVIPTFDSGYPATKGVARELQLPIVDAITTSHYVGRTFIQPGQDRRVAAVNGKHNIVPDQVIGKRIIVVDDSAVRLTTSTRLVEGFKNAGAKEIYMAFASPPVVDQCDLGIDMRGKGYLPGAQFNSQPIDEIEKNIAKYIGAAAVIYLPIEETAKAMGGKKEDFYYYPFGGPHPIRGKQPVFPKRKRKMNGKLKICIFISGNGTNMQEIINQAETGNLDAEIIEVLSNKKDAGGLARAKEKNIPTTIISYDNKLSNKQARDAYDKKLIEHMKTLQPDIIVLAGWMLMLGDSFIKAMQEMEVPVINLHPALLTKEAKETVATSRGEIPVIRGTHAIQEAFEKNLPVSGVTVHQILPSTEFDSGPILMKAEVRRKQEDTAETWEQKIHETEYMVLPTALKRVTHVMKQGIDVSKGEFPW